MCIRLLLPLAMCTTTMDARITTTAARTSAHPSRRAGLRILSLGTATRAGDKTEIGECRMQSSECRINS